MQIKLILIFITYQALQILLIPFLMIYLLIRKINKKPAFGSVKERLGLIPRNKVPQDTIWIHAVSVGEIGSIQNLIKQIKKEMRNVTIYVTTGTKTGKITAQKNLQYDYLSFLPFDFLPIMLLAFKRIKPKKIIIIEAETWPNLLFISKFFNIPTYLLNARISDRSKSKYNKLRFFFKPIFNICNLIFVQSKKDKSNFKQLGINSKKLTILGNIKALNVIAKKKTVPKYQKHQNHATLLVGSLHPGELTVYLNLFKKLKNNFPNIKLILAPRHFHWKKELIEKLNSLKLSYYLWETQDSLSLEQIENEILKTNNVLLVCKLGELFKLYQICDIFFLGGTFVPIGGHNLLEPATWKKLSLIGPNYQNCQDIADKLEKNNALIKIKNETKLFETTNKLLSEKKSLKQKGDNAYSWLLHEASIVQTNLNLLIDNLK